MYLLSIKYNVVTEKNAVAGHVLITIGGKTFRHNFGEKVQKKRYISFYIFFVLSKKNNVQTNSYKKRDKKNYAQMFWFSLGNKTKDNIFT